ncbi:MAG: GNVR domain-containing protein [bacterium]
MPQYELNIRDYLRIFRRRKIIIILTFFAVTLGSAVFISMQTEVFQASSTVKILERKTVAGLLTEWVTYNPADMMSSQTKIIKGFSIVQKVAVRMGLINDSTAAEKIDEVILNLQSKINTERVSDTNIIQITASSNNAEEVTRLANMFAEVYVEESLLEKTEQARNARKFIEDQLSQLESRLAKKENRLKKVEEKVKNIRLAEAIQRNSADLQFKLNTLLQKYTEEHPRVKEAREQIKDLESQLKDFSGEDLEYARLSRELEADKKLFSILKERLEEARINEAQKVGDVSVVNPAVMPLYPISPQKKIATFIGGLAGLLLGIVFAFLFETLDTSIGTIEDVEKLLGLPILGVIPSITPYLDKNKDIFRKFKDKFINKSEVEEGYIRLITHYKPLSHIAESYRNIRTNIEITPNLKTLLVTSTGPREGKSTVMVNVGLTFAQKGLKTLLVSTDLRRPVLAETFGLSNEPGIIEVVTGSSKLENSIKGISDFMLGKMALEDVVKTGDLEKISILPSGRATENISEILGTPEFAKLIEELKSKFDIIIFDSPPVLPIADASILAPKVDGVILCYEIGKTARGPLLRTKIQLESVGAKLLGVILNHTAPQTEAVEFPYYYGRYKNPYGEPIDKI